MIDFLRVLPDIFQDIDDADFVALDGEFTGILTLRQMGVFDTPAERYQRHHEVEFSSKNFAVIIRFFSVRSTVFNDSIWTSHDSMCRFTKKSVSTKHVNHSPHRYSFQI